LDLLEYEKIENLILLSLILGNCIDQIMSLPAEHIAKIIEDFILTIRGISVIVLPSYVTNHETDPSKLFLFMRDKLLSENDHEIVTCLSQIKKKQLNFKTNQ